MDNKKITAFKPGAKIPIMLRELSPAGKIDMLNRVETLLNIDIEYKSATQEMLNSSKVAGAIKIIGRI